MEWSLDLQVPHVLKIAHGPGLTEVEKEGVDIQNVQRPLTCCVECNGTVDVRNQN